MHLVRMKLNDWRGIDEREVSFEEGVTIVEGPNEIGKTSLVEALTMLINDLASSNKASVKNVQPVGRDLGSSVEAEITSGEYRFIYRKTFNKGKTTELNILAPAISQLAGREAHDHVLELLGETADMDLWKTLLVDQGSQIQSLDLQNSEGLTNALDAAAGSDASGEDVVLLEAAQSEYENFFTLRTQKDKLTELANALDQAESTLAHATAELRDVEKNAERLRSLDTDIRRRHGELPALQKNLEKYQQDKLATDTLGSKLKITQTQLGASEDRKQTAHVASTDRQKLVDEITTGEKSLAQEGETLAPLQKRAQTLDADLKKSLQAVEANAKHTRQTKQALEVARDDQAYVENMVALAQQKKLADNVENNEKKLKNALAQAAGIAIDESGIEVLRNAESNQRVIKGKRDHAATHVAISAERNCTLLIDGKSAEIASGETQEHAVATAAIIKLPGVAEIRVSPPKTAVDLDQELQQAQQSFDQTLAKYGVSSLDVARTELANKQGAQQEAKQQRDRMSNLLGERSVQDVRHDILKLQQECDTYLAARNAKSPVPADAATARRAYDKAKQALDESEREVEAAQNSERELRSAYEKADKQLRDAQNNQSSLQATLDERRRRLESARSDVSDANLVSQLEKATASVADLAAEVARVTHELEQLSPDTIEGLFENADAALKRAKADLTSVEQERAVFDDRLAQAKADGRFETCETAERSRDQLRDELDEKKKRAAAARRLWETLNKHRDGARQAYVRPLRDAIERLGRIVFGTDFQVAVDDDWTLSTRTLNGITLPYDSLSVGAKEQLGILTRLAAAQIVSEHGGVPLIIDDALGFSDPGRLETMGAAIAAAGKSCQVIILTCAPGRFMHVGNAKVVRF